MSSSSDLRSTRAALLADYHRFQAQAPLLYDMCLSYGLTWPSLSAQWLPVEPRRSKGAVTRQMLIGTYTTEGFANQIQLANVTLPDPSTADPAEQFMRHAVTTPRPAPASAAAPAGKRGASAAAAAAAGTSTAAAPAPASDGSVPYLSQGSLRLVHRVVASQELHRIRPFAPSFNSDFAGSSLFHSARDANEQAGSHAQTLALAAARGPEHAVRIYDVGRGAHPAAVNAQANAGNSLVRGTSAADKKRSVASIAPSYKAKDEALLALTGHETGGWPLDWNAVPGAAADGWLVSGDDCGGLCVWNLQDCQSAAMCTMPDPRTSFALGGGGGAGAFAAPGLMSPPSGSPMQRLQAVQSPSVAFAGAASSPTASPPARATSQSKAAANSAPTLARRWHCARGHIDSVVNDVAWLRAANSTPSVFVSVGDDRRLKEWDHRQPSSSSSSSAAAAGGGGSLGPVCSTLVMSGPAGGGVTSVSASPFHDHLLLTAGEDKLVRLWDRSCTPVHTFVGHGDTVTQVSWAPFQAAGRSSSSGGIFASSSKDRRVFVWDSSRIGDSNDSSSSGSLSAAALADLAESGPPELMFVHAGHSDAIEDFCWHPASQSDPSDHSADWLLTSVGSCGENVLQVWQMFEGLTLAPDECSATSAAAAGGEEEASEEAQLLRELEPFAKLLHFPAAAGAKEFSPPGLNAGTAAALVGAAERVEAHHPASKRLRTAVESSASLAAAAHFVVGYEAQLDAQLQQLPRSHLERATSCAPVVDANKQAAVLSAVLGKKRRAASPETVSSSTTSSDSGSSSSGDEIGSDSDASKASSPPPIHAEVKLSAGAVAQRKRREKERKYQQLQKKGAESAAASSFSSLPVVWQEALVALQRAHGESVSDFAVDRAGHAREQQKLHEAINQLVALMPPLPTAQQADPSATPSAEAAAAAARGAELGSASAANGKQAAAATPAKRGRPTKAAAAAKKASAAKKAAAAPSSSSDFDSGSDSSSDGEPLVPLESVARKAAAAVAPAAGKVQGAKKSPRKRNAAASPAERASSNAAAAAATSAFGAKRARVASSPPANGKAALPAGPFPSPAERRAVLAAAHSSHDARAQRLSSYKLTLSPSPITVEPAAAAAAPAASGSEDGAAAAAAGGAASPASPKMKLHLLKSVPSAMRKMQYELSDKRHADLRNTRRRTSPSKTDAKTQSQQQQQQQHTPSPAVADAAILDNAPKQDAAAADADPVLTPSVPPSAAVVDTMETDERKEPH